MDMLTQTKSLISRSHVVIASLGRVKVLLENNPDIPTVFSRTKIFLLLCILVTICFTDEVPLAAKESHCLSNSAPLLEGAQQNGLDLSKLKPDMLVRDETNGKNTERDYEGDENSKHVNSNIEEDQNNGFSDGLEAVLVNLLTSLRHLPPPMHSVLIVMALSWLSWFPFFLFDTDWMGREVYHGDPKGDLSEVGAYDQGVKEGCTWRQFFPY